MLACSAPLTFNLAAGGTINAASVTAPFSIASNVTNPPFGTFTNAINGDCGSGASSGGCGSTLSFIINGFNGFVSNDVVINGVTTSIFFASDIINRAGSGATGAVGASFPTAVPIPPAIALFGLGLLGLGALRRVTKGTMPNFAV